MIITKGMKQIKGYIEYSYRPQPYVIYSENLNEDDLENMFESDTFSSLNELLNKLKPEVLDEIKGLYDAEEVWISNISFMGKSEDGETSADIMFADSRVSGHVTTKINNEDINNRLLLNLNKVKHIIDNTIEGYPTLFNK